MFRLISRTFCLSQIMLICSFFVGEMYDTAIIILIHEVQVQFGKDLYKMQFMTGDNSSVNFECRNQHVEHYSCLGCYGHLNPSHDLTYKT